MRFLFRFAQAHPDFRIPELNSIADLYSIEIIKPENEEWDVSRPFWAVELQSEEQAVMIASRCILVRSIYELYARGPTYEEIHNQTRSCSHLWSRHIEKTSFRFIVNAYNHSVPQARQRKVVESFSYMALKGKINMVNPDIILNVYEEYADRGPNTLRHKHDGDGNYVQIYFGRLVSEGTARLLINKFDVKKRAYFGNTSMEAEISLLMANQTLASPGKIIFDPFVGTGSMAYTSAHFGALMFGSDIDGRQMRGKGKTAGLMLSARQYGVESRILDLCTFDITKNPLRCGQLFDAIVTDPPYGVRAGAKRLGRKNPERRAQNRAQNRSPRREAQTRAQTPYVPPTKPYELSNLVVDLVKFARYSLKPGGRLVFFLPTVTDEYTEIDIQSMLCEGMVVIANSLQDFGSWGRRLITIKKITCAQFSSPFSDQDVATAFDSLSLDSHTPAHKDFREKYFRRFKTEPMSPTVNVVDDV